MCPSKLLATGILASVVVSKFATFRYRSSSELRNQNDTRNQYVASVLSIPKFAKRRYREVANFGIGTLGRPVSTKTARATRGFALARRGACAGAALGGARAGVRWLWRARITSGTQG